MNTLSLLFSWLLFLNFSPNLPETDRELRVFLDCQSRCDEDFIRREIGLVDYVNDRFESDVYVLINSQVTGSGGREYTLQFMGRNDFEGIGNTISFIRPAASTSDEYRNLLVENLQKGLVGYLANTSRAADIKISFIEREKSEISPTKTERDPWNLWVLNVRLNGQLNGDKNYFSNSFSTGVSASRVTENLKTSTYVGYRVNKNRFGEGEDAFQFTNENYNARHLTVWSLSKHWSAGGMAAGRRSDYFNYNYYLRVAPAIEYNFFPYQESNNHYFGFLYQIGPRYFNYIEETVYMETEELRFHHSISLDMSFNQQWGQISGSAGYGQYLHDLEKNRLSLSGNADLRLVKGLFLNLNGSYTLQSDQLNIAMGDVSDEDLLTRRRQLDSSYNFFTSFGIRYRFGSLFNNVVNPRFDGGVF